MPALSEPRLTPHASRLTIVAGALALLLTACLLGLVGRRRETRLDGAFGGGPCRGDGAGPRSPAGAARGAGGTRRRVSRLSGRGPPGASQEPAGRSVSARHLGGAAAGAAIAALLGVSPLLSPGAAFAGAAASAIGVAALARRGGRLDLHRLFSRGSSPTRSSRRCCCSSSRPRRGRRRGRCSSG